MTPKKPRRWLWRLLRGAAVLVVLALAAYLIFTGPRNLSRYPPRETSLYKLPWPSGITHLCGQGNRGVVSHRGWEEFAFDFRMDEGSDVCAARVGVVKAVVIEHPGHGYHAPNNYVAINHGDGTSGWYLHLQKWRQPRARRLACRAGAEDRKERPRRTRPRATPPLHVNDDARSVTLPVSFADVSKDAGVPRMGFRYTSGNGGPN